MLDICKSHENYKTKLYHRYTIRKSKESNITLNIVIRAQVKRGKEERSKNEP